MTGFKSFQGRTFDFFQIVLHFVVLDVAPAAGHGQISNDIGVAFEDLARFQLGRAEPAPVDELSTGGNDQ